MTRLLVLILAVFLPLAASAQTSVIDDIASDFDVFDEPVMVESASPDLLFPDLPANFEVDAATLATMQQAVEGYYAYRRDQYLHRKAVFAWQHVSTRIIFAVVVLIVAVGLYFSWMQFHASDKGRDLGTSTINASDKGVSISSPVLGVIILALSLGFFYLYLVHVYPITDLF
ncbi:MAG: hypothetical protein WBA67_02380 [Jannaschia sp.]